MEEIKLSEKERLYTSQEPNGTYAVRCEKYGENEKIIDTAATRSGAREKMKLEKTRREKIGLENVNTQGYVMKIVEYRTNNDILVEFQDENRYVKNTKYCHFKSGLVSNPYHRTIFGVGYTGEYEGKANKEKSYMHWVNAMARCYEEKSLKKSPSYIGCTVCDEWHYFKNFHEWFLDNFYEINGERMMLDKDILIKNNREYSPNACLFQIE